MFALPPEIAQIAEAPPPGVLCRREGEAVASCALSGRKWAAQSAGRPGSIVQMDGDAVRLEVGAGDQWRNDRRRRSTVQRSELMDSVKLPFGRDVRISFKLVVEADKLSRWTHLAQIHSVPDAGEPQLSPLFSQGLDASGAFQILIRHGGDRLAKSPAPLVLFRDDRFRFGRTYRMDYLIRIEPEGQGRLTAWQDGRQIVDYRGPLGYRDKIGPYLKIGIYRANGDGKMSVTYSDVVAEVVPSAR